MMLLLPSAFEMLLLASLRHLNFCVKTNFDL